MAKFQTTRLGNKTATAPHLTAAEKVAASMKYASSQAMKQLTLQGLKLPTQSWGSSRVRNPAV